MPELPEVETVVRDLRPQLTGRRLLTVRVSKRKLRRPWLRAWNGALTGKRIEEVRRRGKWILLQLEHDGHLVVHLGMTGQFTVAAASQPQANHTHLVFDLDDGNNQLRFRDVRRFGSATFFADGTRLEAFFVQNRLGPEPFDLDPGYWRRVLAGTNRAVKAVLLDQRAVAGVGNIYADESLFLARLHPTRLADSLSAAEATRLRKAIAEVLTFAIERRGSSIRDYVDGNGREGSFQNEFRVYGRTGKPCPRCGAAIERIRLAGRSTHYCACCQKSS